MTAGINWYYIVNNRYVYWLIAVLDPTPPGLDSVSAIPHWLKCHATFMPCCNLNIIYLIYCMIAWSFIACCYVTCEYIIVLILAFHVARFWRGYIFYSSKKIERVRMLGTSSPARACGVSRSKPQPILRLPLPNILWSVPCLAGHVVPQDGLVNPICSTFVPDCL